MKPKCLLMALILLVADLPALSSEDWPMWRCDAGRTAASSETFERESLQLLWQRRLPVIRPAFHDGRLQFDKGYEPVVADNRLFVGSNLDDSVSAFDATTGATIWKFFTEGPVRFAPVAWKDRLFVGSDDGHLYCLLAKDGTLLWKFRAVPSARKLTGNKRVISVWPIRGGPVVHEGYVYFAAGVLPFEGVFVYSLEAASGDVRWLNDRTGYLYGQQPHATEALGGLAPQGYLLVDGEDVVVPSSNAYPARFDLKTGKLKSFKLPSAGRVPGGWFAATRSSKKQGKPAERGVVFDDSVNQMRHEDRSRKEGLPGLRTTISTGDTQWRFADGLPDVVGEIYSMVAASAKLFVATLEGEIYAFATNGSEKEQKKGRTFVTTIEPAKVQPSPKAAVLLSTVMSKQGLLVVMGGADEALLEGLLENSDFRVLVVEAQAERADVLRRYLDGRGLYGRSVTVMTQDPLTVELPPYAANLVVMDESRTIGPAELARCYEFLRPYGGVLVGASGSIDQAQAARLPGAGFAARDGLAIVTRQGSLEGATNYTGTWEKNADKRVKAPLGTLWFDDSLGLFKRSPQPKIVDGVMISTAKDWHDTSTRSGKQDYRLLPPKFSDVYTGRILASDEAAAQRERFSKVDLKTVQASQYRPRTQKNPWSPEQPRLGTRRNLLTGEEEPRVLAKQYGCDGGFDYGQIFTMRSATPAFYDKTIESGPINISGPRSGCTNSVIPAAGVLNVPYFYEGCTCSYPLPIGMSLVSQPQTYEQWTAWGQLPTDRTSGKIQRLGINFGAPGDRVTNDGTLWVDYPSVGGPSPEIELAIEPASATAFYHHSLWIEGGSGWPWVAASGMEAVESVSLKGVKPGDYSLRLVFVEPAHAKVGERVFDVSLQGQVVLSGFDVVKEAGGRMRAVTNTQRVAVGVDGQLRVALDAKAGVSILCGVELIREGLKMDEPLALEERDTTARR